jgi:2-oxoglutarate ferredoxin oxidoreductase subunit gamma
MRKEIRISGFGGQGVVLAGYILGKALALYEGREAVMTQSYGPEARGGASSANVVLSDQPIAYPFVQLADVLVALSQEAYTKFRPSAKQDALILIDRDLVTPADGDVVFSIPATQIAEELGRRMVANVVMLGFFTAVAGLVSHESILQAIQTSVKAKTLPLNLRAFEAGYAYGLERVAAPGSPSAAIAGAENGILGTTFSKEMPA